MNMWWTFKGSLHAKSDPSNFPFGRKLRLRKKIDMLIALGKMKPSTLEYACRVTLLVKKDGSWWFCGNYRPFNLQTC
jgi:hypothetical protein